jgi:hypothetical protein
MPADARPQAPKNRKRSLLHPPSPSAPRHAPSLGNTLRAHGVTNKSHHVCARRRGWWGVRDCFGPGTTQMPQIVCHSRMASLEQTPTQPTYTRVLSFVTMK